MKKLSLLIVIVGLIVLGVVMKTDKKIHKYIITETGMPTSLDPLEADQSQNLPVARMLYATPLEINKEDQLTSLILDRFEYDTKTKVITWSLKSSLKYSDETDITVDDVVFAVTRMLYANPTFPVIEYIVGKEEWLKSKAPLSAIPKGIEVNGSNIKISLSKNVPHPLFRFSLELFSVIPKKCVDEKTNKIICNTIPSSGRYTISKKEPEQIYFKLRDGLKDTPTELFFEYINPENLVKKVEQMDGDAIIAGNEFQYSLSMIKKMKQAGEIHFLPAARFSAILIGSSQPFFDPKCRVYFANEFRKSYQTISGDSGTPEKSLFTKVLPGYITSDSFGQKDSLDCLSILQKEKISWGYVESEKDSLFMRSLETTFKNLKLNIAKPVLYQNKKELTEAFANGKVSFMNGGSGFWAHDPSGDLQMLFTPNLHKALSFVTKDKSLLDKIRDVTSAPDDTEKYEVVNRHIYEQGLFNIYAHVRRFYYSKNKDAFDGGNIALSAPAPWQVFK